MIHQNLRGNLVWVAFLVLAGILFISSGQSFVFLAILGAFLFYMLLFNMNFELPQLPSKQAAPPKISQVARDARLQASHRPDYEEYYTLNDLGLIVDEQRRDGLKLRRVHTVSMDERAVRPYIVVQAPSYGHPTQVLVRFEITDAQGVPQFIYEMNHYMRSGENAILPNYRLPLRNNDTLSSAGKWDLHVWVNGGLLGWHTFDMNPSLASRQQQFGVDGELRQQHDLRNDPMPVSLDEIISQQHQASSS